MLQRRHFAFIVIAAALLTSCTGNETNDNEKRSSTTEETKFVTQMVTVEETVSSRTTEESCAPDEQAPEDLLALQYEYINTGNFEEAYALFAERSQQEVSLGEYRAFFEANAPYSVTDYSFSPARVQGDSSSVEVEFTATSASGVERLERTQEFVCENEEWRVVMRPEQVAIFTATGDEEASAEPAPKARRSPQGAIVKQAPKQTTPAAADLDCADFDYQEDAQAVYDEDPNDPHGLDGPAGESYTGEQGVACEDRPSRFAGEEAEDAAAQPEPPVQKGRADRQKAR